MIRMTHRLLLCTAAIALAAPALAGEPPLVTLEGTRWACVDGEGMHWGVRFQPNGVAIIDAPVRETLQAKWGRNGNKLAYSVNTGFEVRIAEVSGKTMEGEVLFAGHREGGGHSRWSGMLVEDPTSVTKRPPILYTGMGVWFSQEQLKSIIKPGESMNLTLRARLLANGKVADITLQDNTPPSLRGEILRTARTWVFLPKIVAGVPTESTVRLPFTIRVRAPEDAARAGKPFGSEPPAGSSNPPAPSP